VRERLGLVAALIRIEVGIGRSAVPQQPRGKESDHQKADGHQGEHKDGQIARHGSASTSKRPGTPLRGSKRAYCIRGRSGVKERPWPPWPLAAPSKDSILLMRLSSELPSEEACVTL